MKTKAYKKILIILIIISGEINAFILGKGLLQQNYQRVLHPCNYNDIVNTIFNPTLYNEMQFQEWFLGLFPVFLLIYLYIYMSQVYETTKYRSLTLYRYGKDRYFMHCKQCERKGNLCAIVIMVIGLISIRVMLLLQGNNIHSNVTEWIYISLYLIRLFLFFELYGTFHIYLQLRIKNSLILAISACFMFFQLLFEIYGKKLYLLSYSRTQNEVLIIFLLVLSNVIIYWVLLKRAKKKSMC